MVEDGRLTFKRAPFKDHIKETYETGASYVPGFFTPRTLGQIRGVVADLDRYFEHIDKNGSNYYAVNWHNVQDIELMMSMFRSTLAISHLLSRHDREFPGLSEFQLNVPLVLRYDSSSVVKPHRDYEEFEKIGVTVTIDGLSDFHIHEEKDGPPVRTWQVKPGDAVFLRMTGFNPEVTREDEVFHSVDVPLNDKLRTSIAYRYEPFTPEDESPEEV